MSENKNTPDSSETPETNEAPKAPQAPEKKPGPAAEKPAAAAENKSADKPEDRSIGKGAASEQTASTPAKPDSETPEAARPAAPAKPEASETQAARPAPPQKPSFKPAAPKPVGAKPAGATPSAPGRASPTKATPPVHAKPVPSSLKKKAGKPSRPEAVGVKLDHDDNSVSVPALVVDAVAAAVAVAFTLLILQDVLPYLK